MELGHFARKINWYSELVITFLISFFPSQKSVSWDKSFLWENSNFKMCLCTKRHGSILVKKLFWDYNFKILPWKGTPNFDDMYWKYRQYLFSIWRFQKANGWNISLQQKLHIKLQHWKKVNIKSRWRCHLQPKCDEHQPQVPDSHLGGRVCKKGCILGSWVGKGLGATHPCWQIALKGCCFIWTWVSAYLRRPAQR